MMVSIMMKGSFQSGFVTISKVRFTKKVTLPSSWVSSLKTGKKNCVLKEIKVVDRLK